MFSDGLSLTCPIRGKLSISSVSESNLKPLEEKYRVQAISHLLDLGYPPSHFKIETVVKRFGNGSRNSLRCDFAVLDKPAKECGSEIDEILEHAVILCEVKRDNAKADYVKNTQVKPLLDFAKKLDTVALYWADVEQRVFWQEEEGGGQDFKRRSDYFFT